MIGLLFAGHIESPGKTVEVDGEKFKSTMVLHLNTKKVIIKTLRVRKFYCLLKVT